MYSLGVDIGGSHITSCVYYHTDDSLLKETTINRKVDGSASKEEILNYWSVAIKDSIRKSGVEISGIGFAIPGPFNYYKGISKIRGVDKLNSLYNTNIREEIAFRTGVSRHQIRFINDASAFSIAEARIGNLKGYKKALAITLGTGLGASFLLNGMPVLQDKNVPPGGFLYNQEYNRILADEIFSTRGILKKFCEISETNDCSGVKAICDKIRNKETGDGYALATFEWFGINLGKFLKGFMEKFGAEALVIGGNISKAFPYYGSYLKSQIPQISIYVSDLGEEAAIIGSALLLEDYFFHDMEPTLKIM